MDSSFSLEYRLSILNVALVQALFHGLYTAIYLYILWAMIGNLHKHKIIFAVMTALYCCVTAHVAIDWVYVVYGFVYHGDTKESTIEYLIFNPPKYMYLSVSSFVASTVIADLFIIWRCWTVWGRRYLVVVVPLIFFVVGTVFAGFSTYQQINTTPESGSIWAVDVINWTTPYFSLSLATTLLCTILIVYRVISVADMSDRTYHNVLEVVIESGALYTLSMILLLAFFTQDDPASNYMVVITAIITGISPSLVVARVCAGLSQPSSTWSKPISRLTFGRSSTGASNTRIEDASSDILETEPTVKREGDTLSGIERGDRVRQVNLYRY